MKFNTLLLAASLFLFFACNNDKKNGKSTTDTATAETKEEASELQKKLDVLQQLKPYTSEEMQALIPVELTGDSATDISGRTSMGTGFASANYKLSDSTSLELGVFDCAGNAGAGIYNAQFAGLLDNPSESDNEYTRIIDFKGGKAIEHADKRRNNSSLTYIAHDRLLVNLEGKNVSAKDLKDIASGLRLK